MLNQYVINGLHWQPTVLTLEKDLILRDMLNEFIAQTAEEQNAGLADVINTLLDKGLLQKAVALMITPSPRHEFVNRIKLFLRRQTVEESILKMTNEQIGEIIFDFFAANVKWMSSYFTFASSSPLSSKEMIPILKDIVSLKNPLYRSPMATSSVH